MTTTQYFIIVNNAPVGPYDLVMLVRKIRNGSLSAGAMVQEAETNVAKPANEWAALAEFFTEKRDEVADAGAKHSHIQRHSLFASLANGWRFLQRNQVSTIYSGMFVLAIIVMAALIALFLPSPLHVPAYMLCFILSHCLLSCYLFVILRMTRGQPVDSQYLKSRILPSLMSLLISSLLVSIIAILGLVLLANNGEMWEISLAGLLIFAIPGLGVLTLYAFTPLLVLDQGHDFWEAMEISRKTVLKAGMENSGVVFALFVINFIAGLCVLLPLVIVLPVTMSPLTEMYDEFFS